MAAAASGSGGSGAEPTVDSAAKRTVGPSVEVAALAEELSGSAKRKADRKPAGVVRISDSQRVPILGKDVEVTVLKEGDGKTFPWHDSTCRVHYEAFVGGRKEPIDSTRHRRQPELVRVGVGQLVDGLDAALPKMSLGERALVKVPCDFAFGSAGLPPLVAAGEAVTFDVELLAVGETVLG